MTRILDVRILFSTAILTAAIGCDSGPHSYPHSRSDSGNGNNSQFQNLKKQIMNDHVPLESSDELQTQYEYKLQSTRCSSTSVTEMRKLRPLLQKFVEIGRKISISDGQGTLESPIMNDLENGMEAQQIVETELCRCGNCVDADGREQVRTAPDLNPNPRTAVQSPLPAGPQNDHSPLEKTTHYTPAQAEADCEGWGKQMHRPCSVQKGRLNGNIFTPDPNGQDICHCPLGTFETTSN